MDNQIVVGDKKGQVTMMDVSKTKIFDTKTVANHAGRRIQSVSTSCLSWLDTKLCYVAVVARASPMINILAFKLNENKLYHLNTINMVPSLSHEEAVDIEN